MRLSTRLTTLSLIVAVAAPVTLHAQLSAPAPDSAAAQRDSVPTAAPVMAPIADPATTAAVGAPLTGLRSGVHARETERALAPNAAATRANLGQARAMMIVGAAALITGAIINNEAGTIIMVGGAIIGLYGLYQYLQ